MICRTFPIKTASEANMRSHWAVKAKRVKGQRSPVALAMRAELRLHPLPCVVKLTRVAPRDLDDDNLRGALKAVRDGVADALGIDDRDGRVTWLYGQRRGSTGQYAVDVVVVPEAEA